jgi:hypothetical protein
LRALLGRLDSALHDVMRLVGATAGQGGGGPDRVPQRPEAPKAPTPGGEEPDAFSGFRFQGWHFKGLTPIESALLAVLVQAGEGTPVPVIPDIFCALPAPRGRRRKQPRSSETIRKAENAVTQRKKALVRKLADQSNGRVEIETRSSRDSRKLHLVLVVHEPSAERGTAPGTSPVQE